MSDLSNLAATDVPKGKAQEHEGIVAEFFHAAAYAALQEPVKGVSQLIDHVVGTSLERKSTFMSKPEGGSGTGDWMAQQLGGAAGMLLPFMLVKGGVKGVLGESIKGTETAATLGMSLKEAGLTGFAYDCLLKPTDANASNNFWVARGLSGVAGAATFMTLTASAYGLGKLSNAAESRGTFGTIGASTVVPLLRNPISAGILSGVPAGLVSAEGGSLANNNKFAGAQEIGQSIAGMAFVGGVFGANEVVKAKYTNGQSIPRFVGGKITDAWKSAGEGPPVLAGGDIVTPQGTRFSVKPAAVPRVYRNARTEVSESSRPTGSDLSIFENAKVQEIFKRPLTTQIIPKYMEDYIALKSMPEATGPSAPGDDGITITPWSQGKIWSYPNGTKLLLNEESLKGLAYDQRGRLTSSFVTDVSGQTTRQTYVYGVDDQLVAAVGHGFAWVRGEDGWSTVKLNAKRVELKEAPETVVAVSATGDLLLGNPSRAKVWSPEGRHSYLDPDGNQTLINASLSYEQTQAAQLAKINVADSAGTDLADTVKHFNKLSGRKSIDQRQSAVLLGEFNRLLETGEVNQAANLLKSTNELLDSVDADEITSLTTVRTAGGGPVATLELRHPVSGFEAKFSTDGVARYYQDDVIRSEFADGSSTVARSFDYRPGDSATQFISPQALLTKVEFKSGVGSSVRHYAYDDNGNITGSTETNSLGTTTTLTKQQDDWLMQIRRKDGSITEHRFQSASLEDITGGQVASTDNTRVTFYIDGDREWFTPDHRVQMERVNGRVDFVSADIDFERDLMRHSVDQMFSKDANVPKRLQAPRKERFLDLAEQFEVYAAQRGLSTQTVALTLAQVNRILNEPSPVWSETQRANIAELVLTHAAMPGAVSQGNNNTCVTAALEHRLYALAPDKIAQLVADVSRDGSYTMANGVKIDGREIPNGLKPDRESRRNFSQQSLAEGQRAIDGMRDFASQIAQSIFTNSRWSETSVYVAHDTLVNDNIAFVHFNDGEKGMIFMQPQNLVSANETEPGLLKVYSEGGELLGKIDPLRMEPIVDASEQWVQSLLPGETGYDGGGKPIVSRTKPGDISFAPTESRSNSLSRLVLNLNGKVIPLREADRRLLDSPQMSSFQAPAIYANVTGLPTTNAFVLDEAFVKSPYQLGKRLLKLEQENQLPALLVVNVGSRLIGQPGTGWHALDVYNFDKKTGLVPYTNQWSSEHDRMDGVPLADLFQAMQPVGRSVVGDASGAPATRPLPLPSWLRL